MVNSQDKKPVDSIFANICIHSYFVEGLLTMETKVRELYNEGKDNAEL